MYSTLGTYLVHMYVRALCGRVCSEDAATQPIDILATRSLQGQGMVMHRDGDGCIWIGSAFRVALRWNLGLRRLGKRYLGTYICMWAVANLAGAGAAGVIARH